MLMSAIMAHFVEINFGIAIVSTRTYFFVYAASLLAVGYLLPLRGEYLAEETASTTSASEQPKRRRGKKFKSTKTRSPIWNRDIAIGSLITALLLLPLLYEYISNISGETATLQILWASLTRVDKQSISYGVLALLLTTWFAAAILFASEEKVTPDFGSLKSFLVILGASGGIGLIYGFWLSGSLARISRNVPENINDVLAQAGSFENLLTQFYAFLILILLILAVYLPVTWPQRATRPSSLGVILAPVTLILVIVISYMTNWRVIQADITFKLAEPFANSKQWAVANILYQRAKDYAPDEDYYDLFLGRGYLEQAKTITDNTEKQVIFEKAEADLEKAQESNPLNPDHTANLARLYSWWALQTQDQEERMSRGLISDDYYSRVLVISPNNARLWNEWSILFLDVLKEADRAYELLKKSLDVDSEYDWTHALLGNYYFQLARTTDDPSEKENAFQNAINHYREAIKISPNLNYYYALATIYQTMNEYESVIEVLEEALGIAKRNADIIRIEENLARFAFQIGRKTYALEHARIALEKSTEADKERLLQLIQQIEAAP
jgi:tetratricopeptide (TPR) repeat protein